MKLLGLFLLVAVASASGRVSDINRFIDETLDRGNDAMRSTGNTVLPIQSADLNNKVSFSDGIILGLDSFKRTGDCFMNANSTTFNFDIHYGFRLLAAAFKGVSIDGKDMSAYFRIRDNSIHFVFTIIRINGCRVTLDTLELERLTKVDFGSSRQEFDGKDVDEVFGSEVLSVVNEYLDSHKLITEAALQFLCRPHAKRDIIEPPYLAFVEEVFNHHTKP